MKSFSLSLAIFRISFSIIYLFFLYHTYSIGIFEIEEDFKYLIPIEILLTFLILVGYKFNIVRIFFFLSNLYLLYLFYQLNGENIYSSPVTFRLLAILNIFVVLLPLNTTLSIDKLLSKYTTNIVLVKSYNYIFITLVISIIYFDGAIYKTLDFYNWIEHSDIYFYKIYLGAYNYIRDNSIVDFIINHKIIAQSLVLLTYIYQLLFIFVVFFLKKFKLYFLFLGIALHLGMAIFFDFTFIVFFTLLLYIPLLPNRFYYRLFILFRTKERKKIVVLYDNSCFICSKYIRLIKIFDFNNKIFLKGKDLSLENEIFIYIRDNKLRGIFGFMMLFREFYITYPIYILLKNSYVYKNINMFYIYFSKNRNNFSCKTESKYLVEYKNILYIYLLISSFFLVLLKFNFFNFITKFYLVYSLFFGIYPTNVFLIKSKDKVYYTIFYFEDYNKTKIYIDKNIVENKYISGYLNNNYIYLDKPNRYSNFLTKRYKKICKIKQKILFKDIKNYKNRDELDKYFKSNFETTKPKCKNLR